MSFRIENQPLLKYDSLQEQFTEVKKPAEQRIIEERNQDMKGLERDIQNLAETYYWLSQMVDEQGSDLDKAEETILMVNEYTDQATKNIEYVAEKTDKKRKRGIYALIGGGSGAGIGAIGFCFGITIGVTTTLISLAVGAATGAAIGKKKA